jgi:starch synthase
MNNLKILFASSEVTPFAKTGGLADVSGSLPPALEMLGHQVVIVMPLYRSVREGKHDIKQVVKSLFVPFRGQNLETLAFAAKTGQDIPVYFIQREEFFDRSGLYGTSQGDYFDNPERFIFFSRSVLELCQSLDFQPDIIHCHDWQTSLVLVYLKSLYKNTPTHRKALGVFTIHNLAYQGVFPREMMSVSELPLELFSVRGLEYYGKMNFMKGGLVFSEAITTVSQKYAQEIQTPEYGYGLEGVLKERSADIFGVLNGVDYSSWNPETDPHIASNYNVKDLGGKKKCKEELLKIFKLKGSDELPVIGMISRLADQKGFDILADALDSLMKLSLYLVILGTGDTKYEKQFTALGKKYPSRLGVKIAFDNVLAHKIEAGSDMFLMPSKYEPCGLNQMYSLKYGTIPIVRATGGLDDTIKEFNPEAQKGNGFKFKPYSSSDLIKAVKRAIYIYKNKLLWTTLVTNAMKEDFSWPSSAKKYEQIYRSILTKSFESTGSTRV